MRALPLSLVLLFANSVSAGILEVPGTYPTIQEAIVAAAPGDTILVSPGTYIENLDFLGKAITVCSSDGPAVTIIDGSGQTLGQELGSVVNFLSGEGSESVLEGFTITNGLGSAPGDIPHGGGVHAFFSAPAIRSNIITGNSAPGAGGGIYLLGAQGSVITGNVIASNSASVGGGIWLQDCNDTILTANTVTTNESAANAGGLANVGSIGTVVTNCILYQDTGPEIEDTTGSIVVAFSLIQGGWPGANNLDENPVLTDVGNGDFHLLEGSPCLDAGSNVAPALLETDYDTEPRIQCGVVDIGADEAPFCPPFLRGDADANGVFNGLVDGLFALSFQFIPGSPEPPCMDAADADDSGGFNGLVDGLYILNFQFVPGSPAPPAPGPVVCGVDPTADGLGCFAFAPCP